MRKQIAAANWKMNLSYQQAEKLLDEILIKKISLSPNQLVIFAVPFPLMIMAKSEISSEDGFSIAAQNCSDKSNGAFTGEISAEMLKSIGINYCIIGHSERREYFLESNKILGDKVSICLANQINPVFCCGESLVVREKGEQEEYVSQQIADSLFNLSAEDMSKVIIAYEPIWAIGTGKTATTDQAQEMHRHLRSVIATKWGKELGEQISILYGGSVKKNNAAELFACPDVDGGLVGGASLVAKDFTEIIKALKK
ncbi:MAG: triose-phosphate isomerase [Flavisolibacter sp.]